MSEFLKLQGVTVSFDGFLALRDLSLTLPEGEKLRLLVGPNGAGKTTLFDVLTGRVSPSQGEVLFQEHSLLNLPEHEIVSRGVLRKFQTPAIFPEHTVLENLQLALGEKNLFRGVRRPSLNAESQELVFAMGLAEHLGARSGELSHGQKQWLELTMLLLQKPKLLLLDEPVAGMSGKEKEKTADILLELVANESCAVLLIEHDMAFVRKLAKKGYGVTVLHEGRVLAEGSLEEVQANKEVVRAYLGRAAVEELTC